MPDQIWFYKYRIIKVLGHGGSADVYLAEHIKLKHLRAIKRISKDNIHHNQLLQEAHILKSLQHSSIPVIYDFEEDAHYSYIIEQYIEGVQLKILRQNCKHLKEEMIINFAVQICDLLQYLYSANQPILYLDLKPENIIILDNIVMLIDFGASDYKSQLKYRRCSFGTIGYSAPELREGFTPDERTDIYGLGTLLYYMVTGDSYKDSTNKSQKHEKPLICSSKLKKVIMGCLRYYPVFRFSSVQALKKTLLGINKKNSSIIASLSKPIKIAIAGSQSRIGATHLSFLITSYFSEHGYKELYIEKNKSNHIHTMIKRNQDNRSKNGIYKYEKCRLMASHNMELPFRMDEFQVIVYDYGCLNRDNLLSFMEADIKLLVLGVKEWELKESEDILRIVKDFKDIKYLFNFCDGTDFIKVTNQMESLTCFRIPFEPNPFHIHNKPHIDEFIKSIVN